MSLRRERCNERHELIIGQRRRGIDTMNQEGGDLTRENIRRARCDRSYRVWRRGIDQQCNTHLTSISTSDFFTISMELLPAGRKS
jgi:hypothetical protein